jgi:hypothetical protein
VSATSGIRALGLGVAVAVAVCGGGAASPGPHSPGAASPGAAGQVAAIEVQIAASDNPTVGFVVFDDVSDKARDGIDREVQLAGTGHIEVLCDYTKHQCEDAATKSQIQQLGFTPLNTFQGAYQKDGAASAYAQALLTERLFLEVLKASPDYRLTYRNEVQKDPAPLPVASP